MFIEHSRPGIAHDLSDLGSHLGLITVDRTVVTRRFAFLQWAPFNALLGVYQERLASRTEGALRMMLALTVHADHRFNRSDFSEVFGKRDRHDGPF